MASVDFKRLKVLVVDDEWFVRTTLRQILTQMGVNEIFDAADATSAQTATLKVQPGVVLCDVHMPGGDGLSYLAWLRLSQAAATPVVMLTSDSTERTVATARGLKVDGYLLKPVSVNSVRRAIERAIT